MKNLENLLSEKLKLTEEDLNYLISALHSHKRNEIDYLLSIKDMLTDEKFMQYKKEIEKRNQEVLGKLLDLVEK